MTEPAGLTEVVVGRVGRAHGVRGEVSVAVRTDEPERRFAVGARLRAIQGSRRWLTVAAVRRHGDRLLVTFAEAGDRAAAEGLRGVTLVTDVEAVVRPDHPDEFYDRQLVGLRVRTTTDDGHLGEAMGTVTGLRHLPAQDLLEIRPDDTDAAPAGHLTGPEHDPLLVPFVRALVPVVDLDGGWLAVAAVPGLLDAGPAAASDQDGG